MPLKKEIHLWSIEHNIAFEAPLLLNNTTLAEKEKASHFHFESDQKNFLLTRAATRHILGQYLKINPLAINFDTGPHGKPYLKHETDLEFNISHSGPLIICAITRQQKVGIDIEFFNEKRPVLNIAKRFFMPMEYEYLAQSPEPIKTFFKIWTLKEAFAKALGTGLSGSLDSLNVLPAIEQRMHIEHLNLQLEPIDLRANSAAAIAYTGDEMEIKYYNFLSP